MSIGIAKLVEEVSGVASINLGDFSTNTGNNDIDTVTFRILSSVGATLETINVPLEDVTFSRSGNTITVNPGVDIEYENDSGSTVTVGSFKVFFHVEDIEVETNLTAELTSELLIIPTLTNLNQQVASDQILRFTNISVTIG